MSLPHTRDVCASPRRRSRKPWDRVTGWTRVGAAPPLLGPRGCGLGWGDLERPVSSVCVWVCVCMFILPVVQTGRLSCRLGEMGAVECEWGQSQQTCRSEQIPSGGLQRGGSPSMWMTHHLLQEALWPALDHFPGASHSQIGPWRRNVQEFTLEMMDTFLTRLVRGGCVPPFARSNLWPSFLRLLRVALLPGQPTRELCKYEAKEVVDLYRSFWIRP